MLVILVLLWISLFPTYIYMFLAKICIDGRKDLKIVRTLEWQLTH